MLSDMAISLHGILYQCISFNLGADSPVQEFWGNKVDFAAPKNCRELSLHADQGEAGDMLGTNHGVLC
jgi:hypothetical protein